MGRQAATDRDPGDEDAPRPPTEVERVQAFKEQQLVDAGFNIMQAAAIVDANAASCATARLASSTSSITCCPNSRRWKTCACRC